MAASTIIYFDLSKLFSNLDDSGNVRKCSEISGVYITNDGFQAEFDKIGSDNVLKGRISSLYKITGTVSIKCTGNAYLEGSGVVTLGFRFEDCKIFWSNNVAWTKVGCTKWNWENYKSLIMLSKHGAGNR